MRRVTIFTQYHMQPPHPRIEKEKEVLEKNNYEVKIVCPPKKKFRGFRYFLSLTMFNWKLISEYRNLNEKYDIIIIYDFALLPLAKYLSKRSKLLIYETIDHNAKFTVYELIKRLPQIKFFEERIVNYFETKENYYIKNYVDKVIVNSKSLEELFINTKKPIVLNYYCSPFEDLNLLNENSQNPVLVYIGRISFEKGFLEMVNFAKEQSLPLYLIGPIDNECNSIMKANNHFIVHQPKISIPELKQYLVNLSKKNFLWGLSLISPKNKSSQIQELNKDIDYLSAGIPIIGNNRPLTLEKINQGAGFLYSVDNLHVKIRSIEQYSQLSLKAKQLYDRDYTSEMFIKKLLNCL